MNALAEIARSGSFTTSDAAAIGLTSADLHRLRLGGQIARVARGIWVLSSHELAPAAASAISVKGRVSHLSSAAWWGVDLLRPLRQVYVTVDRNRGRRVDSVPGIRLYRADGPSMLVRGVPVTPPDRTCIDVARTCELDEAVAVVDGFIRKKLVKLDQLENLAARLPPGPGTKAVARVISLADPLSGSPLETDCRLGMHFAGILKPKSQLEVFDPAGVFIGRADFGWQQLRLLLEADGWRWHQDRAAFVRDRRRWLGFARMDWQTIHVTWDDLQFQRDETFAAIAETIVWRERRSCTQLSA